MHSNQAYTDPAGQAGKQAGKVTHRMRLKPDGHQPTNARSQPERHRTGEKGNKERRYWEKAKGDTASRSEEVEARACPASRTYGPSHGRSMLDNQQ